MELMVEMWDQIKLRKVEDLEAQALALSMEKKLTNSDNIAIWRSALPISGS